MGYSCVHSDSPIEQKSLPSKSMMSTEEDCCSKEHLPVDHSNCKMNSCRCISTCSFSLLLPSDEVADLIVTVEVAKQVFSFKNCYHFSGFAMIWQPPKQ